MDITTIRNRVRNGNFLIKSHAVQHALKEGFERKQMVEAVLNGQLFVTAYIPDRRQWEHPSYHRRKR